MSKKTKTWLVIIGSLFILTIVGLYIYTFSNTSQADSTSNESSQIASQSSVVNDSTQEEMMEEPVEPIEQEFLFEDLPMKEGKETLPSQEGELTFRSVGDVLIHDRVSYLADTYSPIYQDTVANMLEEGFEPDLFEGDAAYDFMPMLAHIQPYLEYADISMANLEVIAASPQLPMSGYPQFNAPSEIIAALKRIGIDIVSNATNHTLDWFSEGAHYSLQNLQEEDMMYVGSYESWEDYNTNRIIEANGISIGFLNYSYGTNGIPVPAGEEYLISLIDVPLMVAEVEALSQQVDAVVVSLQLGNEYDTLPNEDQFYIFQALSDAGAKLILGGHPHVLQPVDWYNNGETFAIYSQASFLTGQRDLDNKQGGITEVTFQRDESGEVNIVNPKFMPIFNLGVEAEKMYQVVPFADIDLHQIPDGQLWWNTIDERMHIYVDDFEFVTHLETEATEETIDTFR
ncbi:CapA family protein [Ruoffia tabacinasalis]|uniref:CapA family protein n=1 Tax=Ruoffia tabacinasalis TaxID=87458 RepID=A0A5R9EGH7_9LACT|nr:CapA family protein [Ruoffia tabacinasalis]TLQ49242.1 CapA family protein [Ruoffia tabacinasalis]